MLTQSCDGGGALWPEACRCLRHSAQQRFPELKRTGLHAERT